MTHHADIVTQTAGALAGPIDHGSGPATARGSVADVVTVNGAAPALGYRVRLYSATTGRLLAERWSTPGSGAYGFDDLELDDVYIPVALDHTGTHKPVAAGPLTPTPT